MEKISRIIQEKRIIKGLSRKQLARELNVLTGSVFLWENSFFNPDLLSWIILGKLLEIEPNIYQEYFHILERKHKIKEKCLSLICVLSLSICICYIGYYSRKKTMEKKQGYEFVVSKQWNEIQMMYQGQVSFFRVDDIQKDALLNILNIDQWIKVDQLPPLEKVNEIHMMNIYDEEILYIYECCNETYFSFFKDQDIYKIDKILGDINAFIELASP